MFKLISVFLFSLLSVSAFSKAPVHTRIEDFQTLSQMFHQICFDKNGNFLKGKIYSIQGTLIDCDRDVETLSNRYQELEREVERTKKLNEELCAGTELDPKFKNLSDISDAINGQKVCPAKTEPASECMKQLTCNAFSSVLGVAASGTELLLNTADKLYKAKGLDLNKSPAVATLRSCVKPSTSCLTNLLKGVWDSLFTSVKGIWTIVKGAAKLGKNAVVGAYDYVVDSVGSLFSDAEDATSEKMMVAQQLPDSALDKFMADPLAFVKDMAKALYDETVKSIKEHYGCEQWAGVPYMSKCLVPMANWECATCNQKANVICGVVGFAAGEIVTAFFTGGTVAVAKTVGMTAVKGGAVLATRVGGVISRIPKVSYVSRAIPKVLSSAGKATHHTYLKVIEKWEAFNKLRLVAQVNQAARTVGSKVQSATIKVTSSRPVQLVSTTTQLAAKPFTGYLNLMTKSFGAGYRRVDDALASRLTVAAPASKTTSVVPEVKVAQEVSRVGVQERALRLSSGHHDPKDLKRIIEATGDQLDDPVKFDYVMDELSALKVFDEKQKAEIMLRLIDDVKKWQPHSTKARLAVHRSERLKQDAQVQFDRLKEKHPHWEVSQLEKDAKLAAYAKRARALELKKSCGLNAPTEISAKAGTLYGTANLALTVGSTAVTYALANWNDVKDTEWAKRLGYEIGMSYLIAKWGSKIATNQSSSVAGKIVSGYGVNFKTNLIESTVYSSFFSHDDEKARAKLDELMKSPTFDQDMAKLQDYIENRSQTEKYVDAATDSMKMVYATMTGKAVKDITTNELAAINQNALKDPMVIERLMDHVSDQLYSEEIGGNTYGNRFIDRLAFDTEWGLHAVPRSVLVGMMTYQAVCANIDNPAKALMAFGVIQGANKLGSSLYYYDKKSEEINQ